MDLYVGIAKCLSEMSDTEIDRIAQVTEVQYVVIRTTDKNGMGVVPCARCIVLLVC